MPVDPATQLLIDDLLQLYADAQQNLLDETIRVASNPTLRSATYRQRLAGMARAVDEAMEDLDAAARGWTSRSLPQVYALGAERAAAQAGERFNWTQIHREAVQVLAQDTYQDLLQATRYVRADTKRFIRYAAREHARTVLLEGKTATQAGRQLAQRLQSRGIAAVTYRNGARHSLRDYSDTVIRTKSAMAYNGGAINIGREHGIEWVQVSDGAGCGWEAHGSTDLANGSVRTLADAEEHPIAHPRCARSFAMLPVSTRAEAEAVARGDYSALQPARTPAPTAGGGGHQKRLAQRQARLEARSAKLRTPAPPPDAAREAIAAARTVDEVRAATSSALSETLGRPVAVEFVKGLDVDRVREASDAMVRLARAYPEARLDAFKIGGTGRVGRTYGVSAHNASRSEVTITTGLFKPNSHLLDTMKREAAEGWSTFDNIEGIVAHEFGHVLDKATYGGNAINRRVFYNPTEPPIDMGRDIRAELRAMHQASGSADSFPKWMKSEVSEYAGKDEAELVAEAFSQVWTKGDAASEPAKLITESLVERGRNRLAQKAATQ